MDPETEAFFAALDANRARREHEAEMHRRQLTEQARQQQVELEKVRAIELAQIARAQKEAMEREEELKNSYVKETQTRMAELEFTFTWG